MTKVAWPRRGRQRAMAARQALRLCEAALPQGTRRIQGGQDRVNTVMTRAALRAVGLPPPVAAALRNRLRLIPDEDQR